MGKQLIEILNKDSRDIFWDKMHDLYSHLLPIGYEDFRDYYSEIYKGYTNQDLATIIDEQPYCIYVLMVKHERWKSTIRNHLRSFRFTRC